MQAAAAPFAAARAAAQGDADVLVRFAQYATRRGDFAAAQKAVDRVIQLDPLNPRAYRTQAALYYAQRRFAESIAPGEKALALNPRLNNAHSAIADALLPLKKPDEALTQYRAEPSASFRLAGLAIALRDTGDAEEAE